MSGKALFLDRDGTLIVGKPYLFDPDEVALIEGVRDALILAQELGYLLFLFTNQSGVGRGYFDLAAVETCNNRLLALLDLPAPGFSGICIAPESPDDPVKYRKPSPRYLLETIDAFALEKEACWMAGDWVTDIQAGLNAGIQAVAVSRDPGFDAEMERIKERRPFLVYPTLQAFVEFLGNR